jgi:multidrug efflux pump subunit AcrA (membrane-fusion protein)
MKKLKSPVIAAVLLAALVSLVSCSRSEANVTVAGDTILTVPVTKVTRVADLTGELTLTAEFAPFQEVDVMAKVAGYVQSIKVDIGDHVKEGQVLATLEIPEMEDELAKAAAIIQQDDSEVETAKDELWRAESAHELQHLSLTRIQDVAKREKGLVPQQQVDEFRSRDLVAEAQVSAAKSGRVARITDKVQQSTRTMDTEVDVVNPGYTLVPGMYAEVKLRVDERKDVLALPLDAIEMSGAVSKVYAIAQPGVIRVVTVTLGLETPQRAEIKAGLEEGDLVVVGRKAGLKDGEKVQTKMADFVDGTAGK